MTLPCHSERYKYQCLNAIKFIWLKKPDKPLKAVKAQYESFLGNVNIPEANKDRFHKTLSKFMVDFLIKRYEYLIENDITTIRKVERLIAYQPIQYVYDRLVSMINVWQIRYMGPMYTLGDINNNQSVHASPIVKHTNDGVASLLKIEVQAEQKTLLEIERAWSKMNTSELMNVLHDMKEWGERKAVMGPDNLYRTILRALWSHIKSVPDFEVRDALIKRLWEECKESVDTCADGHVARLVNVLVGFDERFGNNISPKVYFQNNMSIIAGGAAPQRFKIEQAIKLMDYVNMPAEERVAWLDALND